MACTLVSGVRSSCEASEISWRWASRERSSAASIVLKLADRRPSSSRPPGGDAMTEVLRAGDTLGRAGEPAHGHERRARHEQPQRGRQRDPAEHHDREHEPQVIERAVEVAERQCDLPRSALRGTCRQHAHGRPVYVDVAEEGVPVSGRHRPRGRS